MKIAILLFVIGNYLASGQPPPHPLVVAVRNEEESLPPHFRSPAFHNPHLREVLPLTSLLHKGENAVYERQSDNIPRKEIYNILTHAGFVPRRQSRPSFQHHQVQQTFPDPFLFNPDHLQHL